MNLAISKIKNIKLPKGGKSRAIRSLKEQMEYIISEEKTDKGILVSSYQCTPATAVQEFVNTTDNYNQRINANVAYHLKQSFKPGEVSPDEAHQIGIEYANRFLKGDFQFVISTHTDKAHLHNHIIFCATSFRPGIGKYNDCTKERYNRERINDAICKEHNLSVVERKSGKKGWRIWESDQYKKQTKREKIQEMIRQSLNEATGFEEFVLYMNRFGCEVKAEKEELSFRLEGAKKYIHSSSFWMFDEETGDKIQDYLCYKEGILSFLNEKNEEDKDKKYVLKGDRKILIVQVEDKINSRKIRSDSDINTINKMIKTLNYLEENKLRTDGKFITELEEQEEKYEVCKQAYYEKSNQLKQLSMTINYGKNYWKYKKIYEKSVKENLSSDFVKENEKAILDFLKAKNYIETNGIEEADLNIKGMIQRYQEMRISLEELKNQFENSKNEYKKILAVKANCEMILKRKIDSSYDNEIQKIKTNQSKNLTEKNRNERE